MACRPLPTPRRAVFTNRALSALPRRGNPSAMLGGMDSAARRMLTPGPIESCEIPVNQESDCFGAPSGLKLNQRGKPAVHVAAR